MNRIFDADRFREVWVTIASNKRRSLLTAFGVFWGVFMLVVMLSMGKGIQNGILSHIDDIPRNMSFCWTQHTTVPYAGFRKGRSWDIKEDDIRAIKTQITELKTVTPVVNGRSVSVVNGDKSGTYMISGVGGEFADIMPLKINDGRYINGLDVAERRKVVVLGQKIVDEIYKGVSPVGRYVTVGGISYQCIGVSESTGSSINIGGREEEMVRMPYTLTQQIYNMGSDVHMLAMIAGSDVPIAIVEDQIRNLLYTRHSISPEDKPAMEVMNLDQMLQIFRALVLGISILIWIVGTGTLLSGAVGVSNVIMITVKERTREIGVRRAIGAKPRDITGQIISESLVITMLSGMLGLVAGVLVMYFVGQMNQLSIGDSDFKLIDPMISFGTAAAAFAVIAVTGVLAGLMPAARAMKIKAIDAIREE